MRIMLHSTILWYCSYYLLYYYVSVIRSLCVYLILFLQNVAKTTVSHITSCYFNSIFKHIYLVSWVHGLLAKMGNVVVSLALFVHNVRPNSLQMQWGNIQTWLDVNSGTRGLRPTTLSAAASRQNESSCLRSEDREMHCKTHSIIVRMLTFDLEIGDELA